MVNPIPTAADPQRYLQILEQLNQKWKEIEVPAESILSEQENAQRATSRILHESNRQNKAFPCLVQDHQLVTVNVRSMGDLVKSSINTSFGTIPQKSVSSGSSRKLNVKEKVYSVAVDEFGVKETPKISESKESTAADVEPTPSANDPELNDTASLRNDIIKGKVSAQMDIGCHFIPTDQELIACLVKKVTGGTVPKFIQERDLYGNEEPKDIFKNNPVSELYFVTPIKTKFDSGKKVDRIVGNGTWKIQNNKDIFNDPDAKNKIIGCKRTLNFMENTKGKRDSWIMHEYILKDAPTRDHARWAVCRVKRGRGNFTGLPVPSPSTVSPQTSFTSSAPPQPSASFKRPVENDADADAESNMPDKKKLDKASDGLLQLGLTL